MAINKSLSLQYMPGGFSCYQFIADKKDFAVDSIFLELNFVTENGSGFKRDELLGYSLNEIEGCNLIDLVHPDDKEVTRKALSRLGLRKELRFENRILRKDGSYDWYEWFFKSEGQTIYAEARDITKRKRVEEKYKSLAEEYETVFESTQDAMFLIEVIDENTFRYLRTNHSHQEKTGFALDYISGKTPEELIGVEEGRAISSNYKRCIQNGVSISYEETLDLPSGKFTWATTLVPVIQEDRVYIVVSSQDITDRKHYEEQLKYASLHDRFTGLYNRVFFEEELNRLSNSEEYPISILYADIDGLKLVNDSMGHAKGDKLIKECAGILKSSLKTSDVLARTGGDEFAAILPRTAREKSDKVVEKIHKKLKVHNEKKPELPLSVSIGVDTAESGSENLEKTFVNAEDFMNCDRLYRGGRAKSNIIEALLITLAEKDYITEGHAQRISDLCILIGEKIGLTYNQLGNLVLLARVHDLGKVGIPDDILKKDDSLNDEEWFIMRKHSEKGCRIASSLPELAGVADLVLKHHERWDGKGYPFGIKGEEIPVECRILSVVDAYDAMTSERPYRQRLSSKEAVEEIKRGVGKQFDPEIVKIFMDVLSEKGLI